MIYLGYKDSKSAQVRTHCAPEHTREWMIRFFVPSSGSFYPTTATAVTYFSRGVTHDHFISCSEEPANQVA